MIKDELGNELVYWPISGLAAGESSDILIFNVPTPVALGTLRSSVDSRVKVFCRKSGVGSYVDISATSIDLASLAGPAEAPDLNSHWMGFYFDIIPRYFLETTPSLFEVFGGYPSNIILDQALNTIRAHSSSQNVFSSDGMTLNSGGTMPNTRAGLTDGDAGFSVNGFSTLGALLAICESPGGTFYIWSNTGGSTLGSGVLVIQE